MRLICREALVWTLRENQRATDVEFGRLLRSGQPVMLPFEADISSQDWRLAASGASTAQNIASRLLSNQRLIRAVAHEYDVRVLFVWQPALFAKSATTAGEEQILSSLESDRPGFINLYREVDRIWRELNADESSRDAIILTDLFRAVDDGIFFDLVHINEIGNRHVAESIVRTIVDAERLR